jgi:hypothetical protein
MNYERYINESEIIVFGQYGLNNKLNALLGYLNKANKENRKLKFIWINEVNCPGKFSDLFEDIPNLEIIDYEIPHDIKTHWAPDDQYITDKYFNLLKPKPDIVKKIDEFKNVLGSKYIACHIRRTDIIGASWVTKHTTDEDYINFINQHDTNLKIFIATDNRETQDTYRLIYGDRIVYKDIIPSNNVRQTSLEDAVVDMYVCAGATYFLGYEGSSFSVSINLIRDANKI